MRWLVKLYDQTLIWSQHRHAPRYLAAVSFVEASVFPIPPYFMQAPMTLTKPHKAFVYALIATVASVSGGLLGYVLGWLVFKPVVVPVINALGYTDAYQDVIQLMQSLGFSAVMLAGFMPIPYKLVAIASGFVQINLVAFFLASCIGRGVKFFALALLIRIGGVKMEQHIRSLLEKFGLVCLFLVSLIIGLRFVGIV